MNLQGGGKGLIFLYNKGFIQVNKKENIYYMQGILYDLIYNCMLYYDFLKFVFVFYLIG